MPTNNLPFQPTSFVGREKELAEIAALLADPTCRLLTLVGAGGIGKTRLALQAAEDQQPDFADGIAFVPLAPVGSTDLLPSAIAGALEVSFFGSEEPHIQLVRYLREKHMLLVMDNFEHLLEGTGLLTDLLQAAPNLKILATSRERLNLQEEWVSLLDGLSFPAESFAGSLEDYSAVQLFAQRARQVNTHFSLVENTQAVLSICRQVEGMPLGLELAASWLRAMSCQQIDAQIASDLDFLTTPLRNIPERHRSLRAVFDQSWRMLSENEQAVLMKLSVFRGGFDLQGAEKVAGASLHLMAKLVDKSFIRFNNVRRYDLHELLRQYASEKLVEVGESAAIAQGHLDYFIMLADQAEEHLFGKEQILWFDRLEIEFDNLRTALAWSVKSEAGLQLAASLGWFFTERSYWSEGLDWLERALMANPNVPSSLRAKAFHLAGALAAHLKDKSRLHLYCEQAITIARHLHDYRNLAWSLCQLGLFSNVDLSQSTARLEESLALFRQIEDPMGLAHTLIRLSWIALMQNEISNAHAVAAEAATLTFQAGDIIMSAWVNATLGRLARQYDEDFKQAQVYFENSILFFDQARIPDGINMVLISLAGVELAIGDLERAQKLYWKALILHSGTFLLLNQSRMSSILAGLANIAKSHRQFERAAQFLGAANADWLAQIEILDPEFKLYESDIAAVRAQIGEKAFTEAWAAGIGMTRDQAMTYALEESAEFTEISLITNTINQPFTNRELEIMHLIADGLNSREIAQQLILSVGTIRWYLKQIYSKLDAHSRSEAIARARDLKILN